MDKDTIQTWAEHFVSDLDVGGERVPLDRVIAAHLASFEALRASGLTWRAIAAIIARAGGRRANGRPISPDQLRADVSRLVKRQAAAVCTSALSPRRLSANSLVVSRQSEASILAPRPGRQRSKAAIASSTQAVDPPVTIFPSGAKDVSDTDVAAVLALLKHRP